MKLSLLNENTGSQYNLLTNHDDTLLAMAEVEGIDMFGRYDDRTASTWLARQIQEDTPYSVIGMIKHLQKIGTGHNDGFPVGTVYGSGGGNRWYVYRDGSLMFSRGHASREAKDRARQLGFEIQ